MSTTASRRTESDTPPTRVRYKRTTIRATRRRKARVLDKWQSAGWELETETPQRFRTALTFRREVTNRRWGLWTATGAMVLLLVAGLVVTLTQMPFHRGPLSQARDDAAAAVQALNHGDLPTLDQRLASYRGQPDFAYFFTSRTTPRALGDALATIADTSKNSQFKQGVDAHAYDLALTDLAGTIALATHGTGDRALPKSWTENFIAATTTPRTPSGDDSTSDASAKARANQDQADKQNLLLLLSRGYWSTGFLKSVTAAYWDFDHSNGDSWPSTTLDDAKYAPAPNGRYLTDGVLALTAALTANPTASDWAFTDFQPGTETVSYDGNDHAIGKFTHYLFFEHHFPASSSDSKGDSVGMTAALTALSSAIDATGAPDGVGDTSSDGSPMADSLVLQGLAKSLREGSGCSWNPLDYGHCAVAVAEAVWHWVQHWGHSVLDILALTTFAPPPFDLVGVGAATTNATWYAVDGDYTNAGLSLAAAVPGLAFGKLAKAAKVGIDAEKGTAAAADAEKAAKESDEIAKAANEVRAAAQAEDNATVVTAETLSIRPALSPITKAEIRAAAPKTGAGDFIDPNTAKIIPRDGPFHYGHKPGYEWRCAKGKAIALGWTVQQLTAYFNDPSHFQIEDPASNLSHQYESDTCVK